MLRAFLCFALLSGCWGWKSWWNSSMRECQGVVRKAEVQDWRATEVVNRRMKSCTVCIDCCKDMEISDVR